jgi:hypothetical protein
MDRPKSKRQASPDVVQGLTVRAHSHGTAMQYSMKAIAQLATITEVIALSERAYDRAQGEKKAPADTGA